MQIKREIRLLDSAGGRKTATVLGYVDESTRECHLSLCFEGRELQGVGTDFFIAFCRIREQLAGLGILPVCYGASRNVWPNGMMMDMFLGLSAMRHGAQAFPANVVDIFDDGPDLDLVSVEDQRAFARALYARNHPSV